MCPHSQSSLKDFVKISFFPDFVLTTDLKSLNDCRMAALINAQIISQQIERFSANASNFFSFWGYAD